LQLRKRSATDRAAGLQTFLNTLTAERKDLGLPEIFRAAVYHGLPESRAGHSVQITLSEIIL